jgi:hypothetical protein
MMFAQPLHSHNRFNYEDIANVDMNDPRSINKTIVGSYSNDLNNFDLANDPEDRDDLQRTADAVERFNRIAGITE